MGAGWAAAEEEGVGVHVQQRFKYGSIAGVWRVLRESVAGTRRLAILFGIFIVIVTVALLGIAGDLSINCV